MTDTIIYWVVTGLLLLVIAWLLVIPAPGHEPVIQWMHGVMA